VTVVAAKALGVAKGFATKAKAKLARRRLTVRVFKRKHFMDASTFLYRKIVLYNNYTPTSYFT
jgi:hypothetical protein